MRAITASTPFPNETSNETLRNRQCDGRLIAFLYPSAADASSVIESELEKVRLASRLVPHRHRSRAELLPAHQLQVEEPGESREQCRPMPGYPRMDYELVFVDQSQLRQC